MNREFVLKILKAKKLEYEALKDIMPEKLRTRIDKLEYEAVEFVKETAVEFMKESVSSEEKTVKKETKKIKVDFS